MRRREFIAGLGAAAWPVVARAQQVGERVRRIGWLVDRDESDPQTRAWGGWLREALQRLGWIEGQNLRIDVRFGTRDRNRIRDLAMELVRLAPDAILTNGAVAIDELRQQTQTIPIVFTAGLTSEVRNTARPEGNITGLPSFEPSISGKWLELLKEVAPHLARVGIVLNPLSQPVSLLSYIDTAAAAVGVEAIKMPVRNNIDVVRMIDAFAAKSDGGLVIVPPPPSLAMRDTILDMAIQHRLPTISGYDDLAVAGALLSYGANAVDHYRGAASYIDRLLRGAKVSDLPVQFPTRYELLVNLKTAKAIDLLIPDSFLLRADQVIE